MTAPHRCVCGRFQPDAGHEPDCPWRYLPTEPPTDEQVERASAIAREKGWLVGDEWIWEARR